MRVDQAAGRGFRLGRVGRLRCEPGWMYRAGPDTTTGEHLFWFIWGGQGQIVLPSGVAADLRPGVVCLLRPGLTYAATQLEHDRLGVVYARFIVPAGDRWRPAPEWSIAPDFAFADAVLRRMVTLVRSARSTSEGGDETVAAGLLSALLDDLASSRSEPAPPRMDPRSLRSLRAVSDAATRILEEPGAAISVARLAATAGQSVSHFVRLFRQVHGVGPKVFAMRARLARAQELMQEATYSVSEVSAMLGYSSPQFFSRQYAAHFGRPPSREDSAGPLAHSQSRDSKTDQPSTG